MYPAVDVLADSNVVFLVVVALVFSGVYRVITVGVNIKKKNIWLPIMVAFAAVVNIIFNFLLIPRWGMMGAAWATVIAYAVMCLASYIVDEYYFPIRYEWGRILKIVGAMGVTYATSVLTTPEALSGQIACGVAMLLLYPALLGAFGFYNEAELATLRRLANLDLRSLLRGKNPLQGLVADHPAAAPAPAPVPVTEGEPVGAGTGPATNRE